MNFGINLYSLRKQISTPDAFLETARRLCEMGYRSLQISGMPLDKELIRSVCTQTGLPAVLTHVPFERIENDTAALVAEHDYFGCRNVGLGMMRFRDLDDTGITAAVASLEAAGRKLAQYGAKFFYHHHSNEFCKLSTGETIFDYILHNTEHVNITLDTYWLQHGGVSILDYVKRAEGRLACVHLKDYLPKYDEEGKLKPNFAPVGEGNINWGAVIPALRAAGTEHFLVEQDDATSLADPLGQVESSIRYLNQHFAKGE